MSLLLGLALSSMLSGTQPQDLIGNKPPKLVLLISIDQFREDYLERFMPYYLPATSGGKVGGFRFLAETGANFRDAHHYHAATETGPGHATLMTGSEPCLDGIVSNDWFNREANHIEYCVDDKQEKTVGGTSKPMSPRNLKVTTVGDELKLATNGKSRVVGISFKDRAAILMAGHSADTVIWFDTGTGNWVTSTFYAPSGNLPSWVQQLNSKRIPDTYLGQAWEPALPASAYRLTRRSPAEKPAENGKVFSHRASPTTGEDKPNYGAFTSNAFGQKYVFQTVEWAIDAEKLGNHSVPDVLVVNLATNDYVGHQYGPNSPEVFDMAVRTDRLLSGLFNSLHNKIPGGLANVEIVVTADHGVVPIPEESGGAFKTGVKRGSESQIIAAIDDGLSQRFGAGKWVLGGGLFGASVYLDRALVASKGLKAEDVESVAAEAAMTAPGVKVAFTRTQVMENRLPAWDWIKSVANEFDPSRAGDILVYTDPGYYFGGGTGTGHGTPWAYDTHVPLLVRGPEIRPGSYSQRVYTEDIASTLCHVLGIEYPTGNMGKPLPALGR